MSTDSPDLVIAKRLLDQLKLCGFQFRRTASGPDGPLLGTRVIGPWTDTVHLAGFSRDCFAWRRRNSSLIVPGDVPVEHRTLGTAPAVLNEVLTWKTGS
ncbi:MAG: hypothetical protein ACRDTE_08005 [Pseudonocardiaceae bacterium]